MPVGVPCAMKAVSKAFGGGLGGPLWRTGSGAGAGAVAAGAPAKEGSVTEPQPPSMIAAAMAKKGSHERCMLKPAPDASGRSGARIAPLATCACAPRTLAKRFGQNFANGATERTRSARQRPPRRQHHPAAGQRARKKPNLAATMPVKACARYGWWQRRMSADAANDHAIRLSCHHAAALGAEVVPLAVARAGGLKLAQLARHLFVLAPGGIEFGAQISNRIEQVAAAQGGGLGKR